LLRVRHARRAAADDLAIHGAGRFVGGQRVLRVSDGARHLRLLEPSAACTRRPRGRGTRQALCGPRLPQHPRPFVSDVAPHESGGAREGRGAGSGDDAGFPALHLVRGRTGRVRHTWHGGRRPGSCAGTREGFRAAAVHRQGDCALTEVIIILALICKTSCLAQRNRTMLLAM
ncbi:MAG: hypothetical protein ACK55I_45835, partial [bacterium]